MISLLQHTQMGLVSPRKMMLLESSRRIINLKLSVSRRLEKCFLGGISSIDLDESENRYLLSGSFDGGIFVHDMLNFKGHPNYTSYCVKRINSNTPRSHKYAVNKVEWYPFDTGFFMSSGMDHQLRVWDTNTLKVEESYTFSDEIFDHNMSSVATSYNLIAVALNKPNVALVDLRTGSPLQELKNHNKAKARSVRWSSKDPNLLVSGTEDGQVYLWDVRSSRGILKELDLDNSSKSKPRAHYGAIRSMIFTPDGQYLLSWGKDNYMRLWDVARAKNTLVNYGKVMSNNSKAPQISICYDTNPAVVFVPHDHNINSYSLFSGYHLQTLHGHFKHVNSCVVRQGYQELYSAGSDLNILTWTADIEQDRAYIEDTVSSEKCRNKPQQNKKAPIIDSWSDSDSN